MTADDELAVMRVLRAELDAAEARAKTAEAKLERERAMHEATRRWGEEERARVKMAPDLSAFFAAFDEWRAAHLPLTSGAEQRLVAEIRKLRAQS